MNSKNTKQKISHFLSVFLIGFLTLQIIGVVFWFMPKPPQPVQAAISSWTQTSQADFQAGTADNIDTYVSAGDIKLNGDNALSTNGGFENWTAGMPDNWLKIYYDIEPVITATSTAHSGSYAVQITDDSDDSLWAGLYQDINQDLDGQIVTFSLWAKTGNEDESDQIFRINWKYNGVTYNSSLTATDSWQRFSTTFTVVDTLTRIYIYPTTYGSGFTGSVIFDDVELSNVYETSGSLTSSILDTGDPLSGIAIVSWTATTPTNTSVTVKVRSSNNADMSGASEWETVTNPGYPSSTSAGRYLQYKVELATSDTSVSPTFSDITVQYGQNIGYIQGTITRSDTSANIPIAKVTNGTNIVYTNTSGYYIIPVEADTFNVTASKELYDSNTTSSVEVSAGETETVNISLTPSGEWPMFGGSMMHTRNTPITANMGTPGVAWMYPLKPKNPSIEAIEDVDGDGEQEIVMIAGERMYVYKGDGSLLWETRGGVANEVGNLIGIYDLDNDGIKDVITGNYPSNDSFGSFRIARLNIFNGQDGSLQYSYSFFDHGRGHCGSTGWGNVVDLTEDNTKVVNIDSDSELEIVVLPVFAYEFTIFDFSSGVANGTTEEIGSWSNNFGDGFTIGDVDDDGTKEIIADYYGDLSIYNSEDGSLQYQYEDFMSAILGNGPMEIIDVDNDGINEIIKIANYDCTITVFDADEETVKWQQDLGGGFLRSAKGSVADVDGDGQIEIVVGVDSDKMYVLDASDGTIEWSISSRFPKSLIDIDNDGTLEILADSDGWGSVTPYIYDCSNDSCTQKATFSGKRWALGPSVKYLGNANYYFNYSYPNLDYLNQEVIVWENGVLTAYDGDSLEVNWNYNYPAVRNIAIAVGDVDEDSIDETIMVVDDGTLRILDENGEEQVSISINFGSLYLPKVADLNGDGANEIIVQGWPAFWNRPVFYSGEMEVLDASNATLSSPPEEVDWSYSGGYWDWYSTQWYTPMIDDLDGDGDKEILFNYGPFYVKSYDGETAGSYVYSNYYIGTGYFNSDSVKDIFLTNVNHDFRVLDGANILNDSSVLIWSGDKPTFWIPAVVDTNGDNIDDIVAIAENNYVYAYDGSDGSELWNTSGTCSLCFEGTIVVGDMDGDGENELNTSGNFGSANYELNGTNNWQEELITTENGKHLFGALVDVDSDGALDLVQPYGFGVRAMNGPDGTELWHYYFDPKVAVSNVVAADIDGDNKEEIIFSANDGYLYALNKEDGSLAWRFYFGYQLGSPIVADTDNDGEGEILVASNGYLYCLDKDQPTISGIHSGRRNTVYQDGTIAYSQYPTSIATAVDLTVTPLAGTLYTSITTWNTSGDYSKEWTETSSASPTVSHTVGDLNPFTYYTVWYTKDGEDQARLTTLEANSSGEISFDYDQGFSTVTFNIEADTTSPTAFTLSSPSNNSSTSETQPTFSWNATTDSESGLAKYHLYIDDTLDTDDISSGTTSVTPTNGLACGSHTWFIRTYDNNDNYTDSNTFNLSRICGVGLIDEDYEFFSDNQQSQPPESANGFVEQEQLDIPVKETQLEKSDPSNLQSKITINKNLKLGDKDDEVIKLKIILKQLDLLDSSILATDYFDQITEAAVKVFQRSVSINPIGVVGPRTRKALDNQEFITNKDYQFTQDLEYNDQGEEVKQLQTRLRDQAFFPYWVKSTSWFNFITKQAVELFQKFHNLIPTGIIESLTREKLNQNNK
ncbi:peptidoglycan-binding protein [Patescibacteria group bacterium]|nr:peptidoglycan-binding protein [Patescibacteria group bacterium]